MIRTDGTIGCDVLARHPLFDAERQHRRVDRRARPTSPTRHENQDELERRQRELEEADRRKDEFLAMLAHELRNPLAPIRNASELLAQSSRTIRCAVARSAIDRAPGARTSRGWSTTCSTSRASPAARSSCSASRSKLARRRGAGASRRCEPADRARAGTSLDRRRCRRAAVRRTRDPTRLGQVRRQHPNQRGQVHAARRRDPHRVARRRTTRW